MGATVIPGATFIPESRVLKKYMIILKMCFTVNQINDLQSSNKKIVMDLPSAVLLSQNLTDFSTQQYCHVKYMFKIIDKMEKTEETI